MPATTAGQKIRGYEGQLYYEVPNGQNAIFANVTDIDVDVKADEIDFSDHATEGWKDKASGLKEWSGTLKINAIQNGVDLVAFYGALTGAIDLALQFRPQDVTGGLQYAGTCSITSYKHSSPNSGAQTLDISVSGRGALVLGTVTTGGQG